MPLILNLETSTHQCSVALTEGEDVLAYKELGGAYTHAENLTVFIQDVCREANLDLKMIKAVAVSKGPGSYTGLRIGISTAKGLCYALGIPLIGIPTLQALANVVKPASGVLRCPLLDARRMEVYCAIYDADGIELLAPQPKVIDETSFLDFLEKYRMIFFGDGALKCSQIVKHPNAIFIQGMLPGAPFMAELSARAFAAGAFEDVAYFEPAYLKEFYTGK
jgi:tRNA threonylcarbamoyladenosine biosynthesis protein TsaB